MSEILELISSQLDEHQIHQIAHHLGTDPDQTQTAIAMALPTLVSAFSRSMETPDGSEAVQRHMQHFGGGSLGDLLGGILGKQSRSTQSPSRGSNTPSRSPSGRSQEEFEEILPPGMNEREFDPPPNPRSTDPRYAPPSHFPSSTSTATKPSRDPFEQSLGPGNELSPSRGPAPSPSRVDGPSSQSMDDILGNVLGGKKKRVEDAIGRSSGLDLKKVGPLLMILAPIVLGAMRMRANSRAAEKPLNPTDLSEMMRGERNSIEQRQGGSMIGRMLDQDGDGDFDLSDMFKLGMKFLFGRR